MAPRTHQPKKPALRLDYGKPAEKYARGMATDLRREGFRVIVAKTPTPPVTLFGGSTVASTNFIEIHQFVTDYWPLIVPFIPDIVKGIKNAVRKKRSTGDDTVTRVKLEARDKAIVDFNDKEIATRLHKNEGAPMIVPEVSERIVVVAEADPFPTVPKKSKKKKEKKKKKKTDK